MLKTNGNTVMVHLNRTTHCTKVSVGAAPGRVIGRSMEEVWRFYFEAVDKFFLLQLPLIEISTAWRVHSYYTFDLGKLL